MTMGAGGMHPLTSLAATPQPGQVGLGPRFVEEDEPPGIEARLAPPPRPPRPGDVRAVLLAGAKCLFLYVSPIFASA